MSNPTPTRSRKSSITSRRAPASLRIPSLNRRPSNPNTQLSFIFAQGDSARPHVLSEDSLSKQLDGDLGGKQMGLRSRRSSSATVRTVRTSRTASGLRSPTDDTQSVTEEDEDERNRGRISDSPEPLAGPSTSAPIPPESPSSLHLSHLPESTGTHHDQGPSAQTMGSKTINPKSSSSWLRWTSPAPSFPRSPSVNRDKGKGKAKEGVDEDGIASVPPPKAQPSYKPESTTPLSQPMSAEILPANNVRADALLDSSLKPPDQAQNSSPSETAKSIASPIAPTQLPASKSRGWFGRVPNAQTPNASSKPDNPHNSPKAPSLQVIVPSTAPSLTPEPPEPLLAAPDLDASPQTLPVAGSTAVPSTDVLVAADPSEDLTRVVSRAESTSATSMKSTVASKGWKGYLGWAANSKPSSFVEQVGSDDRVPEVATDVAAPPIGEANQSQDSTNLETPTASVPAVQDRVNESEAVPAVRNDDVPGAPVQPWSSYLYSFIVPEVRPPRPKAQPEPSSNIVEPSAPDEDQKPVHQEAPQVKDDNGTGDTPVPESTTIAPSGTPSQSVSPPHTSDRRPSTTGWLTYLAMRASQKRIAGGSVITAETDGKNSGDGSHAGEEVMDFSSDPDFPSATDPSKPSQRTLAPSAALTGRDVKVAAESIKSITPKASQNLDVKAKKRLSNASIMSNGSLAPMSVSPKARSSLDQPRPGTSAPKTSGSALPPPPLPTTSQPNLVIPTFSDTFDRPPRSLLPMPATSDPTGSHPQSGIAATTTGLAWKALGAVGSYVYGGVSDSQKVTSDTIHEDEKETRGRKEGRRVGAELPRRIGLGAGSPDDGWKHVKRVVVVGVHGWFPAKMLNSVIGEPTGTSVKFASMMGQAVKRFFQDKGVDDLRLTLMPLEGEGTIESRVDRLYKAYLSNPAWINDLRRADAIFFAAHSQGCIVTTHLISRMIAQGHIRTPSNGEAVARCEWAFGPIGVVPDEPRGHQKVALLAMCGVHLGPLYSISTSSVIQPYLQWFENAAARELFEFQDSTSAVSQAYQKALSMVLENEVRVVLLASLNDQVVPIYGASFSTATHPLLLRALYVDGASYTQSDFMTNLLCFAFMLRNAGIDDQRLVEHLSEATAGSLTGVGHSTPYEELSCYALAVDYLFHSGPARHPIQPLEVESFSARDAKNDFELPWIMRALVDSPEVKDLFPTELKDLKEGILNWRPTTKALREIKKRLEPMAGRQSRLRAIHTSPSNISLASAHEQAQLALSSSPGKATGNVAGIGNGTGASGNKGLTSGETSTSSRVRMKSRL
ncbi:hypothetical protein I316_03932 [Kwoniella heveanensis BCC8398]|uniref:YMC020W-like alpha/beta hydrolase domain-containing protein n=1 Tax=Kwoniella heveanensis BCC8398 TaxID=1296120 RepID=A0A1B9GTW9_9TREE|nr:hypothetical protein I316_03932 [Kwoniella heveanensis BCC8398]